MSMCFILLPFPSFSLPGFLPIIYTWLQSKRKSSPAAVQLQPDADHDPDPLDKLKPLALEGWKVLLLWIPAACDLTGTTVSPN